MRDVYVIGASMTAFGRFVRPLIEKRAKRLWVEDGQYAERRYELRMEQEAMRRARENGAG